MPSSVLERRFESYVGVVHPADVQEPNILKYATMRMDNCERITGFVYPDIAQYVTECAAYIRAQSTPVVRAAAVLGDADSCLEHGIWCDSHIF